MRIGVPKEIKIHEYRVGLVPSSVRGLVHSGHQVSVEKSAGAGIVDGAYRHVGWRIVDSAGEVFSAAEMLVKVKEPKIPERELTSPAVPFFAREPTQMYLSSLSARFPGRIFRENGIVGLATGWL